MEARPPQRFRVSYKGKLCSTLTFLDPFGAWPEIQDNLYRLFPLRVSMPQKLHAPHTKQDVAFRRRLSFPGLATCDFEPEDPHTMLGASCFDVPYISLFILPPMDPLVYKSKVKHELKEWIEAHRKHEWLLLYGLCNRAHALEAKQNAKTLTKLRHTFINLGVNTTRLAPIPMPSLHLVESEELVKCDEAENEETIAYKDWIDLSQSISERLADAMVSMHIQIQNAIKSAESPPGRNVKKLAFELDKLLTLYIKCGMFQEACIGYSKVYTLLNQLHTADDVTSLHLESALSKLQFDFFQCSSDTLDLLPILEQVDKDYNGCIFTMKNCILERQLQLLSRIPGIESLYCMSKLTLGHFMDCYSRIIGHFDFAALMYTLVINIVDKLKNELESRFDIVDGSCISHGIAEVPCSLGNNLGPITSICSEYSPSNCTLVSTDALKQRRKGHSIFKLNALRKRLGSSTKGPGHTTDELNGGGAVDEDGDEAAVKELYVAHFCDTANIIQSCWRCLGWLYNVAFKLLSQNANSAGDHNDSNSCTCSDDDAFETGVASEKQLDALKASSRCFCKGGLKSFGQVQDNIYMSLRGSKATSINSIPWRKLRSRSVGIQTFAWIEPLSCDSNSDGCAASFAAIGMDVVHQVLAHNTDALDSPREMCMHTPVEAEPQAVALYLEAFAHFKNHSVKFAPDRVGTSEKSQYAVKNGSFIDSVEVMDETNSLTLVNMNLHYFESNTPALNGPKPIDKVAGSGKGGGVRLVELPRPRMKMGKERRLIIWVHIKGHYCPVHGSDDRVIYNITATLKFSSTGLDNASTGDKKGDVDNEETTVQLFGKSRLVEGANRVELDAKPLLDGVWRLESLELGGGNLEHHRVRLAGPIPLDFISSVAITAKKHLPLYWTPEATLALLVAPPDLVVARQTLQVYGNICEADALQVHAGCRHYVRLFMTMEHSLESLDLSLSLNGQPVSSKPTFSNNGLDTLDVSWCVPVEVPRTYTRKDDDCNTSSSDTASSLTFGSDVSSKTFEAVFHVTSNTMHGSFNFIAPIVDVFELQLCSNDQALDLLVTTFLTVEIHSVKVGGDSGSEQCDVPILLPRRGKFRAVLNDTFQSSKVTSPEGAAAAFVLVAYKLFRRPCRHVHGGTAADSLEQVSALQHEKLALPDTRGLVSVEVVTPQFAHLGAEFEVVVQFKCTSKTSFDYTIQSDPNWLIGGPVDSVGIELDERNGFRHEAKLTVVPLVQGTCTLPHVTLSRKNKQMVDSVQVFILPPKSDQRVI